MALLSSLARAPGAEALPAAEQVAALAGAPVPTPPPTPCPSE